MPPKTSTSTSQHGIQARALMRGARTAVLSTLMAEGGAPYGSLVLSATAPDATPVLLLSKLAVHTANLLRDPRASLLYETPGGPVDPLGGARLSLLGTISPSAPAFAASDRARFLSRHPSAAVYADFADFGFYRLLPAHGNLVAGFGQIHWLAGADVLLPEDQYGAMAGLEAGIVAHMNADHRESIGLYAERLLGLAPGGWGMSGCDPEGCDLEWAGSLARLPFAAPVHNADQARHELARLADLARQKNP
ncbi:MAG: HugZ family protein [Alphaproteobacteria bacterium]|nr:HugZ family protein [Alphaproteobacteria bacterium]